jgi:ABC-type polysaccharide/polyol phosphate export permease
MATVIGSYRSLVLYGRWGPLGALGVVALASAAVTVVGVVFYLAAVPRFAEET